MKLKINRRSWFLVNPKFQLSFFWYFGLLCIMICVSLYIAIHYFFQKFAMAGQMMNLSKDHMFFILLSQQESELRLIFLSTALIAISISFAGALYLSHRVAGPMLRMQKSFDAMAKEGELRELRFRKSDDFTEVADSFNSVISSLKRKK